MWEQKNTSCWWIRRNEGKRGIKDDCFFGLSKYSVIYWGVEAWTRGGKVWGEMKFQFGLQVGYWISEFELRVESLSLCITSTNHMY